MHKTPSPLRIARAIRGVSQAALARACGVSQPQISRIETARRAPSAATSKAIADALGVPLGKLFSQENT